MFNHKLMLLRTRLDKLERYFLALGILSTLEAIIAKLRGRSAILRKKTRFCQHPVYLRTPSTDIRSYTQIFFRQDLNFNYQELVKIIVDVGANAGFASVYYANRFPNAKIFAIEAAHQNIAILKKNTALYPNITVVHAALWPESTNLDIVDTGRGEWSYQVMPSVGSPVEGKTVQAITIQELCERQKIDTIDILKIDIEGAEYELFQRSHNWLSLVETIYIETHDRLKPGCSSAVKNATKNFNLKYELGNHIFCSKRDITTNDNWNSY